MEVALKQQQQQYSGFSVA